MQALRMVEAVMEEEPMVMKEELTFSVAHVVAVLGAGGPEHFA